MEISGQFLMSVIPCDASLSPMIISSFREKSVVLTNYLRKVLWTEYLLNKEKPKNRGLEDVERMKEKFLQSHSSIRKQSHSSSSQNKVEDTMRKVIKENKCLRQLSSGANITSLIKALNIYSSYKRTFHQHYLFWAISCQFVYLKDAKDFSDGDLAFVAVMLDKVLRFCQPSRDQVFSSASKVINTLAEADENLYGHIKKVAAIGQPEKSIKEDFSTEIILMDKKQGNELLKNFEEKEVLPEKLRFALVDPVLFVRKWISEGFGSILKVNALLFVWDQMFFSDWNEQTQIDACLVILGLLKPWLMLAKNYQELREVLLEETGHLYTLDIKKAWHHVQREGCFQEIADINRNIIYLKKSSTPTPKPVSPEPLHTFIPWIPCNKKKMKDLVFSKTKVDHPFDFYIDSVRFVPDNATIVKVTGKVLNLHIGHQYESIRMFAYPELGSVCSYPQFKMKQLINAEKIPVNPDVVVMLRVYTIELHSKRIVVLGSCLFCPFSNKHAKEALLRVGGHQLRLRHGFPDPDFTVEHMLASHMDDNPIIPACTLLIRVLPHQKEFIAAPEYESETYRSKTCMPDASELRLFKHFQQSKNFNTTIREMAKELLDKGNTDDETLERYIKKQLEKEGSDVEDFPYQRFVNYETDMGLMILADKAAGLPMFLEGRYLQCLVQYFPGKDTRQGNGKSQVVSFITEDLDLNSPQRAPDWSDAPIKINPKYDDNGFFIVALYGLKPIFNPETGQLLDREGKPPVFNLQHSIAWSAVPCFENRAAYAGTHHVPLIKGRPADEIISMLGYLPLDYVCKEFKGQLKVFDTASIEITIWDGHFEYNECPPLPSFTNFLSISSNPSKYFRAREQKYGGVMAELLREGMPNSNQFAKYQDQIIELLKEIFRKVMDEALDKAGYPRMLQFN